MDINRLIQIREDLKELRRDLAFAKMTKDGRSREKRIREARLAISDYAHSLPSEVQGFLYTQVDVNALSYQWADGDIGRCIDEIDKCITKLSKTDFPEA